MTSWTLRSVAASTVSHGSSLTGEKHARSASAPSTSCPTGTCHGPASVRPGFAVTNSTRSAGCERAVQLGAVPPLRDLQLAEDVARPRRCPVRAEAHAQTVAPRAEHVGRVAVEPQVRERRPHDRAATLAAPFEEVRVGQRRRVDPDEAVAHAAVVVEERELVAQLRIDAFGEVVDERLAVLEAGGVGIELRGGGDQHRLADRVTLARASPSRRCAASIPGTCASPAASPGSRSPRRRPPSPPRTAARPAGAAMPSACAGFEIPD